MSKRKADLNWDLAPGKDVTVVLAGKRVRLAVMDEEGPRTSIAAGTIIGVNIDDDIAHDTSDGEDGAGASGGSQVAPAIVIADVGEDDRTVLIVWFYTWDELSRAVRNRVPKSERKLLFLGVVPELVKRGCIDCIDYPLASNVAREMYNQSAEQLVDGYVNVQTCLAVRKRAKTALKAVPAELRQLSNVRVTTACAAVAAEMGVAVKTEGQEATAAMLAYGPLVLDPPTLERMCTGVGS